MFAEILEERRTQKLERYTRHREVEVREIERDRARIEVDAGADTKTTTKMWKRRTKGKKKQKTIEIHTWLRAPRMGILAWARHPPTPNLSGRISNHPMQGSKCLHGKGCQKRVVRAPLNFCLRPFSPALLACGFPSGVIR